MALGATETGFVPNPNRSTDYEKEMAMSAHENSNQENSNEENSRQENGSQDKPEGVFITEGEWKGKKETALYGLTKTPHKKARKVPGYGPVPLRDDAWGLVKAIAAQAPSRRIGAKELVTAFVLAGAENDAWKQAAMEKAMCIPIEDLAKELAKANAEAK